MFCAFVHALQQQLAEDIDTAMVNPWDDDVKSEPIEEEKQSWAHFSVAVETEIRTGGPLIVDGIMSEATRVDQFKRLTFSLIPFGHHCEEFDGFCKEPLLNLNKDLLQILTCLPDCDAA